MLKLNKYLTVGHAATQLRMSMDTLRRWDNGDKPTTVRHSFTRFRLYLLKELTGRLDTADKATESAGRQRCERIR